MIKKPLLILLIALLTGCQGSPDPISAEAKGVPAMKLTSNAFPQEGTIPQEYTGEGKDMSPPLAWSGAPANSVRNAVANSAMIVSGLTRST